MFYSVRLHCVLKILYGFSFFISISHISILNFDHILYSYIKKNDFFGADTYCLDKIDKETHGTDIIW